MTDSQLTTGEPLRMLYVDDDPLLRLLMRRLLSLHQFNVLSVASEEDLPLVFERFQPEIVLTDLEMPIRDGRAVLQLARQHVPDAIRATISGSIHADFGERVLHFTKPIEAPSLATVLRKAWREADRLRLSSSAHSASREA